MEDEIPRAPETLKPIRTWKDWWPGKIGVDRTGNMSGCRSRVFMATTYEEASETMNKFFEDNPGLLSTEIQPVISHRQVGFHLLFTKYTSEEEMADFNRVESKVRELLEAEDVAAAKQKGLQERLAVEQLKESQAKAKADEREKNRLVELGRVHETSCKKKGK